MKFLITLLLSLSMILSIAGQSIEQISVGQGYSMQTFYDIDSGEKTSIDGDSWDISFSVLGFQDASVSVNEASPSMGVELELYYVGDLEFNASIDEADLMDRVYNDESNWNSGAFNSLRDPTNIADYGWGTYNPASMSVTGRNLFVLKLRNGQLKRLMIESLTGTVYTLKYADFDGSNEKTVSIDKSEFSGKERAYFSFNSETVLDLEPSNWDLLFTRYSTQVDDGQGNILNYVVTGVLSASGVEVAEANEINPVTVQESDYANSYETSADVIGYDWKEIDITTFQWSLVIDRMYFIKSNDNKTYKLYFLDFEGSTTGVTTFEKTELNTTSTEDEVLNQNISFYPNPVHQELTIDIADHMTGDIVVSIFASSGKQVMQRIIDQTMTTASLRLDLKPGIYFINFASGYGNTVRRLIVI